MCLVRCSNGKYHLHKFDQKNCPIPGSQVIDEIHHQKAKNEDVKAMDDFVASTEENCEARTTIRKELAKVSTRVIFNTTIGDPLHQLTEIQANKAKSIKEGVIVKGEDSPEAIKVRYDTRATCRDWHYYLIDT